MKKTTFKNLLQAILLIIAGLILLPWGIREFLDDRQFNQTYKTVTGYAIEVNIVTYDGGYRKSFEPTYSYTVDGKNYTLVKSGRRQGRVEIGDNKTIYYDPTNPSNATFEITQGPGPLLMIAGAILFLIGVGQIFSRIFRMERSASFVNGLAFVIGGFFIPFAIGVWWVIFITGLFAFLGISFISNAFTTLPPLPTPNAPVLNGDHSKRIVSRASLDLDNEYESTTYPNSYNLNGRTNTYTKRNTTAYQKSSQALGAIISHKYKMLLYAGVFLLIPGLFIFFIGLAIPDDSRHFYTSIGAIISSIGLVLVISSYIYYKKEISPSRSFKFKNKVSISSLVGPLMIMLISLIFGCISGIFIYNEYQFSKNCVSTTGTVVEILDGNAAATYYYELKYEFVVDGLTYNAYKEYDSSVTPDIGSTDTVYYNPDDPNDSTLILMDISESVKVLLFDILIFIIGLVCLIRVLKA